MNENIQIDNKYSVSHETFDSKFFENSVPITDKLKKFLRAKRIPKTKMWENPEFLEFYYGEKLKTALSLCQFLELLEKSDDERKMIFQPLKVDDPHLRNAYNSIKSKERKLRKHFESVVELNENDRKQKILQEAGLVGKLLNTNPSLRRFNNVLVVFLNETDYDKVWNNDDSVGNYEDGKFPTAYIKVMVKETMGSADIDEINETVRHEVHHSVSSFLPISETKNSRFSKKFLFPRWLSRVAEEIVVSSYAQELADLKYYQNIYNSEAKFCLEQEKLLNNYFFEKYSPILEEINKRIVRSEHPKKLSSLFSMEKVEGWEKMHNYLMSGGLPELGYFVGEMEDGPVDHEQPVFPSTPAFCKEKICLPPQRHEIKPQKNYWERIALVAGLLTLFSIHYYIGQKAKRVLDEQIQEDRIEQVKHKEQSKSSLSTETATPEKNDYFEYKLDHIKY